MDGKEREILSSTTKVRCWWAALARAECVAHTLFLSLKMPTNIYSSMSKTRERDERERERERETEEKIWTLG
jgi:hypothetical protein